MAQLVQYGPFLLHCWVEYVNMPGSANLNYVGIFLFYTVFFFFFWVLILLLSKPGGGNVTEPGVEPTSSGCMTEDRTTDLKRSAVISGTGIHRLIYRGICVAATAHNNDFSPERVRKQARPSASHTHSLSRSLSLSVCVYVEQRTSRKNKVVSSGWLHTACTLYLYLYLSIYVYI